MEDFELQQALIESRRKQYGQQAQTQAPQGRMVGNRFVAPSALEYIAAGLRGAGGLAGEAMAGDELKALSSKRQTAIADALRNFGQTAQGTPAQPEMMGNNPSAFMPAQAATPGDLPGAYAQLMQAPDAGLRQAGMQGMLSQAQNQAKQAQQRQMLGLLQQPGMTPQQAIAAGLPPELVKSYYDARNLGRDKVQFKDVGGQLVPVTEYGDTPQGVAPMAKTGNPFSDLLVRDPATGGMVPNAPLVGVKTGLARSGASRNNTTVINAGPKEFEKELGKLDAEQLGKWRDLASAGQALKGTVEQLKTAESMGAYSGGGADSRLAVANMIEGWTGLAPKGVVGSQLYNAEANKLILDRVKALGANPSNADREFLQKTVPQLSTNAEARKQMIEWMEKQADASIDRYRKADSYARENSGLKGFDMFAPVAPSTPAPLVSPQDRQALDWANANPNDPRSREIKQRLGAR